MPALARHDAPELGERARNGRCVLSPGTCYDMPLASMKEALFVSIRRIDSTGDTCHGMPPTLQSTMTWHADFLG